MQLLPLALVLLSLCFRVCVTLDKQTDDFEKTIRNTYKSMQTCVRTHSRAATIHPPSFQDLEKHHLELLNITRPYRQLPGHHGGKWIENHFISSFIHKPITSFGGLIPLFVQWIDYDLEMRYKVDPFNMFRPLFSALRRDYLYITVSQANEGLPTVFRHFPNVIVVSSGGNGKRIAHTIVYSVLLMIGPRMFLSLRAWFILLAKI